MVLGFGDQRSPGTRFIDPDILARIDQLDLIARTVVDGFISGMHRSPFLGLSIDFAEHRQYMPGDDIRRIDWKVFARTDRFYVKEYEADTNANFNVILDVSRSMDFGSRKEGITKLDYARFLAASLTYLSSKQRDRVGMITFDGDLVDIIPPSAKHLENILHTLERLQPGSASAFDKPLLKVAESLNRRSVLCLISDLYAEPTEIVAAVERLKYRGNDMIVFHVLDPAEVTFQFEGATNIEDLETGEKMPIIADQLREPYQEQIQAHLDTLQREFGAKQIDYHFFDTSTPLDHALFAYLSRRDRLTKARR